MNANEHKWLMVSLMVSALNLKYGKDYGAADLHYETCCIIDGPGEIVACKGTYDEVAEWGCGLLN